MLRKIFLLRLQIGDMKWTSYVIPFLTRRLWYGRVLSLKATSKHILIRLPKFFLPPGKNSILPLKRNHFSIPLMYRFLTCLHLSKTRNYSLNYFKLMTTKILVQHSSVVLFRIMLSGIFLVASFSHIIRVDKTVKRIDQARFKGIAYFFGEPKLLVIASGIVMFTAGLGLLTGFRTRWAAILLAAVLIPITLTIQVGQITTLGSLFKNIAILGGLTFFIINDFNNTKNKNHE